MSDIGTQSDFVLRLKALLPPGWFPNESTQNLTPVLTALLSGPAWSSSWLFSLIAYARLQTRIGTATDVWLDIIALDYFGDDLQRYPGETDAAFETRIERNLLAPKNTRAAISAALINLTGVPPTIFEPGNTGDTGGYGGGDALTWTGLAYNDAGGYGSLSLPFQAFIIAYYAANVGIASVSGYYGPGYNVGAGGYGVGAIEYVDANMISGQVTHAMIYKAVADAAPVATVMWVTIVDPIVAPPSVGAAAKFNNLYNSGLVEVVAI